MVAEHFLYRSKFSYFPTHFPVFEIVIYDSQYKAFPVVEYCLCRLTLWYSTHITVPLNLHLISRIVLNLITISLTVSSLYLYLNYCNRCCKPYCGLYYIWTLLFIFATNYLCRCHYDHVMNMFNKCLSPCVLFLLQCLTFQYNLIKCN